VFRILCFVFSILTIRIRIIIFTPNTEHKTQNTKHLMNSSFKEFIKKGNKMSNPGDTDDKDFVMSVDDGGDDTFENEDNEIYDSADTPQPNKSLLPTIVAAVGFLILIVLLIAVISRTQDLADKNQILVLEQRLERLEGRLGGMEDMNTQGIVTAAPEKRLDLLAEKFDRLETNLNTKIDQIMTVLQRDEPTPIQQKAPEVKSPPDAKKKIKDATPAVHKVQSGETLYRISRQYGITVEQLRAYNNLDSNAKIFPGQELKLKP
jgi:LysM repeat protein